MPRSILRRPLQAALLHLLFFHRRTRSLQVTPPSRAHRLLNSRRLRRSPSQTRHTRQAVSAATRLVQPRVIRRLHLSPLRGRESVSLQLRYAAAEHSCAARPLLPHDTYPSRRRS